MFLQTLVDRQFSSEASVAIEREMPEVLRQVAKQCFGLYFEDPVEAQVLPPQRCSSFKDGTFVFWKLHDVLDIGERPRQFVVAKMMITDALVGIVRVFVPAKKRFSTRGHIPHMGTFASVEEDQEPIYYEGTMVLKPGG